METPQDKNCKDNPQIAALDEAAEAASNHRPDVGLP